jgi:FkbM family methyltransferase
MITKRKVIDSVVPAALRWRLGTLLMPPDPCRQASYSQEGEDRVLARMIGVKGDGFYVDVGAHHPRHLSNTFLFYLRGWRGINIDAQPQSMDAFALERPRDINLEVAVARNRGRRDYYQYGFSVLNGFSSTPSVPPAFRGQYPALRSITVETMPLHEILTAHLPAGQKIDFLSVDVEGHDLEVLESNDWSRFRPSYIVAEAHETTMAELAGCPLVAFMAAQGYAWVSRTYYSVIFRERSVELVP